MGFDPGLPVNVWAGEERINIVLVSEREKSAMNACKASPGTYFVEPPRPERLLAGRGRKEYILVCFLDVKSQLRIPGQLLRVLTVRSSQAPVGVGGRVGARDPALDTT